MKLRRPGKNSKQKILDFLLYECAERKDGISMRLFTAILFHEGIKDSINQVVEDLRESVTKGNFTERDNLHLTVNFIGETNRLEEVKGAMNKAVRKTGSDRFSLCIGGFGRFQRREGDIYWIGVEKEPKLWRLQKQLAKELKEEGFFDIDDREYKPHLTLGRRIIAGERFQRAKFENKIKPIMMDVEKLSLMKSERIQGKLVYTEIYHVKLDKRTDQSEM